MELVQAQDCFNLPVIMFEDTQYKSLSLSAKVLYAVLTDRGTRDNGVIRIEDIDEKEIQRFVSFNDKMYKLAKEQLKFANLLVEVITKGNITFQLQVVEGSV